MSYFLLFGAWMLVAFVFAFAWGTLCRFGERTEALASTDQDGDEQHRSLSA